MEKPTKKYLEELIVDAQNKFDNFLYVYSDTTNAEITYVCTKKQNMLGLLSGFSSLAEMRTRKVKESKTISKNCKYYNKIYKIDKRVEKIECFVGGHNDVDIIYFAFYNGKRRYLFPYFADLSKAVAYPIIVAEFENNNVIEEYRIDGNQIVYEKYDYSAQERIIYYCINFVPAGKYPILGEETGIYNPNTFEYNQTYNHVWCQE